MKEITVYVIETQDTCKGIGTPQVTVQPQTSDDANMIWVTSEQYLVPDDYTVETSNGYTLQLYNGQGQHQTLYMDKKGTLWAIGSEFTRLAHVG